MKYLIGILLTILIAAATFYSSNVKKGDDTVSGKKEAVGGSGPSTSGSSKEIADEAGLFSLNIPEEWVSTSTKGENDSPQSSFFIAQSPDFKVFMDEEENPDSDVAFEKGAILFINVLSRGLGQDMQVDSTEKRNIKIDGVDAVYGVVNDPAVSKGKILDVRFEKEGKSYFMTFGYDPSSFPNGESVFMKIIDSFRFK